MGRINTSIKSLRQENIQRINKLSNQENIEVQIEVSRLIKMTSLNFDMAMKMILDLKEME